MDINFWRELLTGLAAAGAVYGGIRSDLVNLHERVKTLESQIWSLKNGND
jgi:hypothetical protein